MMLTEVAITGSWRGAHSTAGSRYDSDGPFGERIPPFATNGKSDPDVGAGGVSKHFPKEPYLAGRIFLLAWPGCER